MLVVVRSLKLNLGGIKLKFGSLRNMETTTAVKELCLTLEIHRRIQAKLRLVFLPPTIVCLSQLAWT